MCSLHHDWLCRAVWQFHHVTRADSHLQIFFCFNQNKPYPRLCLKSPTGHVTNITQTLNTCSRVLLNSLESIQSLLSCPMAVVCLVGQPVLLWSSASTLLRWASVTPPPVPPISTLASVVMRVTAKKHISSNSPNANSFLYTLRTCDFISMFTTTSFWTFSIVMLTRLALASVLGPFGVHLFCLNSFYKPQCIDALFTVRIPFQSLVQSPDINPDPVQSPVHVHRPWEIDTQDLPIFILWLRSLKSPENAWSFYYIWHSFGL